MLSSRNVSTCVQNNIWGPDKEAGLVTLPLPTPEKMAEYPCKWFIYMKTTEASPYFLNPHVKMAKYFIQGWKPLFYTVTILEYTSVYKYN
jgi:hypothetical protein